MPTESATVRLGNVTSEDGTKIAYHSLGAGPGLIVVGGVLSAGLDYLPLAQRLSSDFEVHLMERRGRVGSGGQRSDHSIEAECADLAALARVTQASAVFGHSFGGLVVLEALRRQHAAFDEVSLYEPGVPVRGQLHANWLDDYRRLLESGDRRGAFASMVKGAGFAPRPLRIMPRWYVKFVLSLAIRGKRWTTMDQLLEASLTEHQIQRDLNAPTLERYSTIAAKTLLLGGAKSPDFISTRLLNELADVLPRSTVTVLPGLGHLAPIEHAGLIADSVLEHHRAISSTERDRTRVLRDRA